MTFHNPTLARCVTTADMMYTRDRRAAAQQQLLSLHKLPLVSFTLNIPGPVKRTRPCGAGVQQRSAHFG